MKGEGSLLFRAFPLGIPMMPPPAPPTTPFSTSCAHTHAHTPAGSQHCPSHTPPPLLVVVWQQQPQCLFSTDLSSDTRIAWDFFFFTMWKYKTLASKNKQTFKKPQIWTPHRARPDSTTCTTTINFHFSSWIIQFRALVSPAMTAMSLQTSLKLTRYRHHYKSCLRVGSVTYSTKQKALCSEKQPLWE